MKKALSRRVRVFKVNGRWWWWCNDCWGGDYVGTYIFGAWRFALTLAFEHARAHPAPPPGIRYVGEPPC